LEIGVKYGGNFFPIKARQKIAVDPHFEFPRKERVKWTLNNPYNILAKYYTISSERYFTNTKNASPPDVVFIDGLHTYQQTLRDVNNSLNNLNENGVIIIHDCNPPHETAAYPADSFDHAASLNLSGWTGEWCGDVWKTILHMRSSRKDLRIFVLNCDYGLGIITRGEADNYLTLSEDDIDTMTYNEFSRNRTSLLNLKDENYIFNFLKTI